MRRERWMDVGYCTVDVVYSTIWSEPENAAYIDHRYNTFIYRYIYQLILIIYTGVSKLRKPILI